MRRIVDAYVSLGSRAVQRLHGLLPTHSEGGQDGRRSTAWNGQFGRLAKSAGFRRNPRQHAGTGAIGQKKSQPMRVGILGFGGGAAARAKRPLKVRDTGVPAS